jgi:hypothetical protein
MNLSVKEAKAMGLVADPVTGRKRRIKTAATPPISLVEAACKAHGILSPVAEYEFHPTRKWRFDYLFEGWLALEVEGGVWTQGRHARGKGMLDDMDKYNEAAFLGYTVLRCTPQDLESGAAFALVKKHLEGSEAL